MNKGICKVRCMYKCCIRVFNSWQYMYYTSMQCMMLVIITYYIEHKIMCLPESALPLQSQHLSKRTVLQLHDYLRASTLLALERQIHPGRGKDRPVPHLRQAIHIYIYTYTSIIHDIDL